MEYQQQFGNELISNFVDEEKEKRDHEFNPPSMIAPPQGMPMPFTEPAPSPYMQPPPPMVVPPGYEGADATMYMPPPPPPLAGGQDYYPLPNYPPIEKVQPGMGIAPTSTPQPPSLEEAQKLEKDEIKQEKSNYNPIMKLNISAAKNIETDSTAVHF
eukprot:scpid105768/ scgid31046/ 